MVQNVAESANDRQTESHSAIRLVGRNVVPHLIELIEDARLMLDCDAYTRVDDVDCDAVAAPPRADDHAAAPRITNGVRSKIANDPFEERCIAVDCEPCRNHGEREASRCGLRPEFRLDAREQRRQRDGLLFGAQNAGLEPR